MADVARLPLAHELVERAERLLERRDVVRSVVLVEIDDVGAQPLERRVDRLADVRARTTRLGSVAHVAAELRGEHDAVAPALECLAEERLAAALVSVDVGGVEERHARSKCRVDDGARAFEIHAHAEVVATEADN